VTLSVFSDRYEEFRLLLIDLRKKAGLTQSELAVKLSKPQSFVSKMERGERRIDVVELGDVAKALGIDPIEIMRRVFSSEAQREDRS
jgi:transcriptional regulator with XRE-family HTH domain